MIKKIDHIVITTAIPQACIAFYEKLGFRVKDAEGRYELYAGDFKINVHILGKELLPHAGFVQTGSADICFELDGNIEDFKTLLDSKNIPIALGIVIRTGVRGKMKSIYLRDPDHNLIEFSQYDQ